MYYLLQKTFKKRTQNWASKVKMVHFDNKGAVVQWQTTLWRPCFTRKHFLSPEYVEVISLNQLKLFKQVETRPQHKEEDSICFNTKYLFLPSPQLLFSTAQLSNTNLKLFTPYINLLMLTETNISIFLKTTKGDTVYFINDSSSSIHCKNWSQTSVCIIIIFFNSLIGLEPHSPDKSSKCLTKICLKENNALIPEKQVFIFSYWCYWSTVLINQILKQLWLIKRIHAPVEQRNNTSFTFSLKTWFLSLIGQFLKGCISGCSNWKVPWKPF